MGRIRPTVWLLMALGLAPGGCRVEPGACVPAEGQLCLKVQADRAALLVALPLSYDIEVRRGADCAQLDQPPPEAAKFVTTCLDTVPTCARFHVTGRIDALPRLASDGSFTIAVDLRPREPTPEGAPADVIVALLGETGCLQAAALNLAMTPPPMDATLMLKPGCPEWHRPCRQAPPGTPLSAVALDHVVCGGSQAQLCCRDRCVAPPVIPPAPGMSFVPAGELTLGDPTVDPSANNAACRDGTALRRYRLTQPLYLDSQEVSLDDYLSGCPACGAATTDLAGQLCVSKGADRARALNCVSSAQADRYCSTRMDGGGLPWEIEWEWATGRGQSRYPWGIDGAEDPATCARANGRLGPEVAGRRTRCAPDMAAPVLAPIDATFADLTPAAPQARWPTPPLRGLAGNVAEWVVDHDAASGRGCPPADGTPVISNGMQQIIRGGSWDSVDVFMKSTARRKMPSDEAMQKQSPFFHEIGVRCAWRFPVK